MTRRRIIKRGSFPIKNYHLIGAGGKQVKPVSGKWVTGYLQTIGKPSSKLISTKSITPAKNHTPPTNPAKNSSQMKLKSSTSLSTPRPGGFKSNVPPSKLKGLAMLKKMANNSPVKAPPKPKVIVRRR